MFEVGEDVGDVFFGDESFLFVFWVFRYLSEWFQIILQKKKILKIKTNI